MPDKIKILILTHNYPRFDGDYAGVFIAMQAQKLCEYNIEPIVLAPHDKDIPEFEIKNGVKIYRFKYGITEAGENLAYRGNMHQLVLGSVSGIFKYKNFLDCFRRKAFDIIKNENIDIIAGNWLIPSGQVMKTLMARTGLPMIMSSHGTDVRLMKKYFKVVYRYLKKFCLNLKSWTVVSNFLRDEIVSLDSSLDEIITVFPLPHDESIFFKDNLILKSDNLVLSVTRFTEQKRVDYLIKAFALVVEKIPEAKLKIIGSGPKEEEILDLISKFGLNSNVEIKEPLSQIELKDEYNKATITVLNSYKEGFGLALSESMMCGTAVIGTDSGGITDIIGDNKRGVLVPVDNSDVLADAIIDLLNNKQKRENLANIGWQYALENYASGKSSEQYAQIIRDAVNM
jgi:glycosyltransferase involved in cell wall biosynthesis